MIDSLLIVVAILLVLLNGFFVAAEFAIVKVRATRLKAITRRHGVRGRILAQVHKHLDAYLSACQLGITLASIGLGWIGEPAVAGLLEPLFLSLGIESPQLIHGVSFLVAFAIISYLHIVVGELAPKSWALRQTEPVALWTASPLYLFYWVMYPAIWVLNHSANWILRLFGLSAQVQESGYTIDELKTILRSSGVSGRFTQDETRVLAHALNFSALSVDDLKRRVDEMVSLHSDRSFEENMEVIARTRFTRYPLMSFSGEIIGLIHLKDLLTAPPDQGAPNLRRLARPVFKVPGSMPALQLFRKFKEGYPHFAIVLDGAEHPSGFITLDNLLSMLVGEISDEFRKSQSDWMWDDDGSVLGKGSLSVTSLERALGIDIGDRGVDSISGLIQWKLERLPEPGERIEFDQFDVIVKRMRGPKILLVKVRPKESRDARIEPAEAMHAR